VNYVTFFGEIVTMGSSIEFTFEVHSKKYKRGKAHLSDI